MREKMAEKLVEALESATFKCSWSDYPFDQCKCRTCILRHAFVEDEYGEKTDLCDYVTQIPIKGE